MADERPEDLTDTEKRTTGTMATVTEEKPAPDEPADTDKATATETDPAATGAKAEEPPAGTADADRPDADRPEADGTDKPAAAADEATTPPPVDAPPKRKRRHHPVFQAVTGVLAVVVIVAALIAPDDIAHLEPAAFIKLPVEILLCAGVFLLLPPRPRWIFAWVAGIGLGLLTILKVLDIGFYSTLNRPFDVVLDWVLLGPGLGVVQDSVGTAGAVGAVVGIGLLVIALMLVLTWAMLRLSRLVTSHRTATVRAGSVLAVAWVVCLALGAQLVDGVPVAARSDAGLLYHRANDVRTGLKDAKEYRKELSTDPYRDVPGDQLLTALRGKDVIFAFVESYGRSALEDHNYAPQVSAVLDGGTRELTAAGYTAKSAYLTSSTAGGSSWLAHASTMSGTWVDNEQRYDTLTSSDRFTLPAAFKKAGWRTASYEPAISGEWTEKDFYKYDIGYDLPHLGYQGKRFSYAPMPDQYVFWTLQNTERLPGHKPLFAEVTMVSSHNPWTPIPKLINWEEIGDGSIFSDPSVREGETPTATWKSVSKVRAAYRKSIEYSLSTLISYVKTYADDNTVVVFLGDHQPAPLIAGTGPNRDVPIVIVAKDKKVTDQIASWGWDDGLKPGRTAPTWRMDTFRNKFLGAYAQ